VHGKSTAFAQFLINPDLSARALWQSSQAESPSSKAGKHDETAAECCLQTISSYARRVL
jgi:hypothetical protein